MGLSQQWLTVLVFLGGLASSATAIELFAAPDGSDISNSSRCSRTAPCSLSQALSALAAARNETSKDPFKPNVTLVLLAGEYSFNDAPLVLGPKHCGVSTTSRTTIRGERADQKSIISGGQRVKLSLHTGTTDVFSTLLPSPPTHLWQLWTKDKATGASVRRFPNDLGTKHYHSMPSVAPPIKIQPTANQMETLSHVAWGPGNTSFAYVYHSWTSSIGLIESFNQTSGVLTFGNEMPDNKFNYGSGRRYRVMNVRTSNASKSFGLKPGSFYYESGQLFYRRGPQDRVFGDRREASRQVEVVIPRRTAGLQLGNCNHATIEHLTFSYFDSGVSTCLSFSCGGQSAAALDVAAIHSRYTSTDVAFRSIRVANVGAWGIWIHDASNHVALEASNFTDVGAGGIRIGEPRGGVVPGDALTNNVSVTNCRVWDGGHIIESGPGIIAHAAADVTISHNAIHDMYYTGISLGWTWNYAETTNRNIRVTYNDIHDIGKDRLSDMGCVYTLGRSPNSIVDHNLCHDVQTASYGGMGLYTDQGSSNYTFTNNVVFRVKAAPFHQHYGLDNIVMNNVLAFPQKLFPSIDTGGGAFTGLLSDQGANPSSMNFHRNIVLLRNKTSHFLTPGTVEAFESFNFSRNCYWNTVVAPSASWWPTYGTEVQNKTFAAWQRLGKDLDSLIVDPEFVDADAYNFSAMKATSKCVSQLGFVPIDLTHVGPQLEAP